MRKKYTVTLLFLVVTIFICLTIFLEYQIYKEKEVQDLPLSLVNNGLAINFSNGNPISISEEEKEISFSITNTKEENLQYFIKIEPKNKNLDEIHFKLTSENTEKVVEEDSLVSTLAKEISISPNETHRYHLKISNPKKNKFVFSLKIDLETVENDFATLIKNQNSVIEETLPNFKELGEESGLILAKEQHGDVYYFRGDVQNNYVSFAGHLWRIVKINEDNTVKLVLNNTTENLVKINEEIKEAFDFKTSDVYQNLESWYQVHLMPYDDVIANTRYCYDDSIITDENNRIEYLSVVRLFTDFQPTNVCGGTSITSKIALLTADEVMFAGGSSSQESKFYLNDGTLPGVWWTMTPNKKEDKTTSFIGVSTNGTLQKDLTETESLFVRPVITLVKRVEATGEGTLQKPYELDY